MLIRERARGANRKFFVSLCEPRTDTPKSVMVADGKRSVVKGVGSCVIWCLGLRTKNRFRSLECYLFLNLDVNLVLVCRLVHFIFDNYGCTVANGDRVAVVAPSVKGLYHLQMVERVNAVTSGCHTKGCIHEWHRKLGHRDVQAILELERKGFATGIKVRSCSVNHSCEICLQGKMARRAFPKKVTRKSKAVLNLIHSDSVHAGTEVRHGGCYP